MTPEDTVRGFCDWARTLPADGPYARPGCSSADLAIRAVEAVNGLDALVAERDALAARLAEAERERDTWIGLAREVTDARRWYLDHFAHDDDEPPADSLTLTQMIERVFQWGDGAWGMAGQQSVRAEAAEAERDALAASRAEESEAKWSARKRAQESESRALEAEARVAEVQSLLGDPNTAYLTLTSQYARACNQRDEAEARVAALTDVRDAAAHAWAAIGHAHWCSRQTGEGDCDCGHAALGAALAAADRPEGTTQQEGNA